MRLFARQPSMQAVASAALRAEVNETPAEVLADAQRRTDAVERKYQEEVKARVATLDMSINVQTGNGGDAG